MTEAYELHKLFGKHDLVHRGLIPRSDAWGERECEILRCSCGLYVWRGGKHQHISCNSVEELWLNEMKGSLQRELITIEAMEYLAFLEANDKDLWDDPVVCGASNDKDLWDDPVVCGASNDKGSLYVGKAIRSLKHFIETNCGR